MSVRLPLGWRFGLLKPMRAAGAYAANRRWLGASCLGIEVTEPQLARRCGLGNLDPQHGVRAVKTSAIEAALSAALPRRAARLVTIRPDADALGAMAILLIRARKQRLSPACLARVNAIGAGDRFDHGSWQSWQRNHPPLPFTTSRAELSPERRSLRAVSAIARSSRHNVAQRVSLIERWLQSGTLPRFAKAQVDRLDATMAAAWNDGAVTIECLPNARVAIVRGDSAFGLQWGYRHAPVVIAEGQLAGMRKLTIAQFEPGWIDLGRLCAALNKTEPGWGGSPTIIGSPQGMVCRRDLQSIIMAVRSALTHNDYSI